MVGKISDELARTWKGTLLTEVFAWCEWEKQQSFSQDRRCSSRDSNQASPEYKTTALPLERFRQMACNEVVVA
jgi:hypothetical protein